MEIDDLLEKHKSELDARDKVIVAKDKDIEFYRSRFHNYLVESQVTAAVANAKGVPALLVSQVTKHVKIVQGENGEAPTLRVVDAKGQPRFDGKGAPLSIDGFVEELKSSEEFGRAFEGNGASGGGSSTSRLTNGVNGNVRIISREDAHDPGKYRAARAQADKDGMALQIEDASAVAWG
jgi:hypothetical protein